MSRPVIGITAGLTINEDGLHSGNERLYISREYTEAILAAGGVPVILPVTADLEAINLQVTVVDAVLLSGGQDIDPCFYGEDPLPALGRVLPERDEYEIKLTLHAHTRKKPVLGICRGLQVINVAFGGTLYQDIGQLQSAVLKHYQDTTRHALGHSVTLQRNSQLFQILGAGRLRVNSYHHQAIKLLAPGFRAVATAGDGIIEAIESDGGTVLGVGWHPEMLAAGEVVQRRIFEWFVHLAAKGGREETKQGEMV